MNAEKYLEYVRSPWGQLFYKLIWHNLDYSGKDILDFGSGLGVTANKLAESNTVTAVEPSEQLLIHRVLTNEYRQLCGSIDKLRDMNSYSFDVIVCHNVLEYMESRAELLREFHRLLKPGGALSIVKHNKFGKIMQKVVFEYNTEEAKALLRGENIESANFGEINEYSTEDLIRYCENMFTLEAIFGVRTFYGLQSNDIKYNDNWQKDMFELECAAEKTDELRNVAFFHHVIFKKKLL